MGVGLWDVGKTQEGAGRVGDMWHTGRGWGGGVQARRLRWSVFWARSWVGAVSDRLVLRRVLNSSRRKELTWFDCSFNLSIPLPCRYP